MSDRSVSEQIRMSIGAIVLLHGFSERQADTWVRDCGWKTDEIELHFKKMYFSINLYLNLPPIEVDPILWTGYGVK